MSPFLKQAWTSSGVLINIMATSFVLTYPASMLPALRADDSPIKVDLDTASWLASCIATSTTIGFVGSSIMMGRFGRRLTHGAMLLPSVVGWLLIYFATNVTMLILGRLLNGITCGATVTLGAVVIGEYTSPEHRGLFLNLKTASNSFGVMITHVLCIFFDWRGVALLALVPLLAALGIVFTWTESPSWLVSKNRFKESEEVFYWLRGKDEDSVREFEALIRAQQERMAEPRQKFSCLSTVVDFMKKFTRKDFMIPNCIVLFGFMLIEACGRHTIPPYALDILTEITGDQSHTFFYTLGMDIIITTSSITACFLVKMFRRRTLLFASGISSLIVLFCFCLYLYLVSAGFLSKDRSWIPISLLLVYFVLSNLGCMPIPFALLGEVYPLVHRSAGTAVGGLVMSLTLLTALQTTPKMIATINVYGTFGVYAVVISISLSVLYFILPETTNRTLQEIEEYFNYGRFIDKDKTDDEAGHKMLELKA